MTHFQIWFLIPPPLIETFINVQVDRDLFFHYYYHGRISHHIHMKEEQDKILKCIILEKLMCVFFFLKGDRIFWEIPFPIYIHFSNWTP